MDYFVSSVRSASKEVCIEFLHNVAENCDDEMTNKLCEMSFLSGLARCTRRPTIVWKMFVCFLILPELCLLVYAAFAAHLGQAGNDG